MIKKLIGALNILILTNAVFALPSEDVHNDIRMSAPWSVTASIGYTNFENMYAHEGQTAVGRLAFDKGFLHIKNIDLGVELGVQNGNSMRLNVSQADLDILGGAPVQTNVNPIVDLLATLTTTPLLNTPIFAQVKGGIAYRSWEFEDRTSINPISNVAGEVQAGVGIALSKISQLSVLYQGIYGGNSNFIVNATDEVGSVSSIPIQNGILLSINVIVG